MEKDSNILLTYCSEVEALTNLAVVLKGIVINTSG